MKHIKEITTDWNKNVYWEENTLDACEKMDSTHVVNVYPDVILGEMRGFGGAITQASAYVYQKMSKQTRANIISDCFSKEGLNYNFARIHINSCDFSTQNYTYVKENDKTLESFSIDVDKAEIIPMVMDAKAVSEKEIHFLASPWSPPAFMKTNEDMNHGGKLKEEYYSLWAEYVVKYIKEYEKQGIYVEYLTIQNEPLAVQTWDSCIYSAKEEATFAIHYLKPAFIQAGYEKIKLFVWDHNKELAYERFDEIMKQDGAKEAIDGCAIHWYTGDHFEAISYIKEKYPDKEVFFTEGCVEYSRFLDSNEVKKAEMYAHDMIGNMNHKISASMDWNVLLDHFGGPNHVGNFCAAPLMCDENNDTYERQLTYYYIGHFSRYIKPQAKVIGASRYEKEIEVVACMNPDESRAIVLCNPTQEEKTIYLREGQGVISLVLSPHTIKTICYEI